MSYGIIREMQKKLKISMISESEFSVKAHGVHTAYLELTRALQKRDDVSVTVNARRGTFDIIHFHTVGMFALGRLLFGSGKKVVTAHIVPASLIGSLAMAKWWLPLARWYLGWFYGRADLVMAVSQAVADELRQTMGIKNLVVHYNTVDASKYKPSAKLKKAAREELGLSAEGYVVVGNGQIQPRKRLDMFIELAKLNPAMTFIWVGGIPFGMLGAEYNAMTKLIKNVPDNVIISGIVEHEKVKQYLWAADVFILPAEQENHPMSVIEAACAGLPVMIRDLAEYADTFAAHSILFKDITDAQHNLEKLQSSKEFYAQQVQSSKAIAKRFDSQTGAELAVGHYKALLSNN